jgi:hypothetical protein
VFGRESPDKSHAGFEHHGPAGVISGIAESAGAKKIGQELAAKREVRRQPMVIANTHGQSELTVEPGSFSAVEQDGGEACHSLQRISRCGVELADRKDVEFVAREVPLAGTIGCTARGVNDVDEIPVYAVAAYYEQRIRGGFGIHEQYAVLGPRTLQLESLANAAGRGLVERDKGTGAGNEVAG